MFRKPVNYFYAPVNKNNYGAVQPVYEWQEQTPPSNLKSEVLAFVKPIKKYVQVEKNFQQQINTQIFYTPEQIEKFGIKLDPTQEAAIYQKVDTKNLNATDIREISKNAVNEQINTMAINKGFKNTFFHFFWISNPIL